jgi:hypothetical protein
VGEVALKVSKTALTLCIPALVVVTGCARAGEPAEMPSREPVPVIAAPTPTAFQPIPPTPEPDEITVWLSPVLPQDLVRSIMEELEMSTPAIVFVDDPGSAQVTIGLNGEVPLTEWIYALAAPFPIVEDDLSWEEVALLWHGGGGMDQGMVMSHSTFELMAALLGSSFNEQVQAVTPGTLLEAAWGDEFAYAVVPFGDLEPRWKVLELGGQSPLQHGFEADQYPLAVEFGLSGDPAGMDYLSSQLAIPATNRDPAKLTTLVMTGVTALTRATAWRMEKVGIDYPGALIAPWMQEADITHVSNEVSFWEDCPPPDPVQTSLKFCSNPDHLALLTGLGVDVVELTGNHNLDFGPKPYLFSLGLYDQNGLSTFAGGVDLNDALTPVLLEHNGNRFAFLGCNDPGPAYAQAADDRPGAVPCASERFWAEIDRYRSEGYLPIVTFQWAEGSAVLPLQREAFQRAVDSGAIIVSGSQAHEPLGFEFYADAFIHYGLGNLFFDQMQTQQNREEFIDRHIFYDGRHISTELLTAILEDYAQPRPMTVDEREALLRRIFRSSGW